MQAFQSDFGKVFVYRLGYLFLLFGSDEDNYLSEYCIKWLGEILNFCTICLYLGYRSVPLKNAYSEEFELSCLLVHIDIRSAMVSLRNMLLCLFLEINLQQT